MQTSFQPSASYEKKANHSDCQRSVVCRSSGHTQHICLSLGIRRLFYSRQVMEHPVGADGQPCSRAYGFAPLLHFCYADVKMELRASKVQAVQACLVKDWNTLFPPLLWCPLVQHVKSNQWQPEAEVRRRRSLPKQKQKQERLACGSAGTAGLLSGGD